MAKIHRIYSFRHNKASKTPGCWVPLDPLEELTQKSPNGIHATANMDAMSDT